MWNWALEIWRMSKAIWRWLSPTGKLDKTSSPMDFHRIKEECKVHFTHRSFICQIWEISILRECLLYHHTRFLIRLIWKYLPNSAAETYPIYLISNLVLSVLGLPVCFWCKTMTSKLTNPAGHICCPHGSGDAGHVKGNRRQCGW